MPQIEVRCPDCGSEYRVSTVDTTVLKDGEPAFWCYVDGCADQPYPMEPNLVGDVDVELRVP